MEEHMDSNHQNVKAITIEAMMFKILLFRRVLMANGMPSKHIINVTNGVASFVWRNVSAE